MDNFKLQKKYDKAYAFTNVTYLVANLKIVNSKKLHYASVKDIPIIHFSVNPFMNIKTGYGFCGYYYVKSKVALSLLLLSNIVSFDTSCLVTSYDSSFF